MIHVIQSGVKRMGKSILFVDDELQILKAIRRLFMRTDYNLYLAKTVAEAFETLENEQIDLVITDMRMPEMGGYEFLSRVKKKYPEVLRLILSGQTEEKEIIDALQNNLAKIYLFKPWDNEELLKTIEQVFAAEEIWKNHNLLKVINNIEQLPTLSHIYEKLSNLIEQEEDISTIEELIEKDPAISTQILKIANSVFFNIRTGSVGKAICYIGLGNVKNIVFSTSVFNTIENEDSLGEFSKDLLWDHANITNELVAIIYNQLLKKQLHNTYMVAGLLHDVGKIVILKYLKDQYDDIFKTLNKNDKTLVEMEYEKIGISHQEIGGYLLKWWNLPKPIVEATLFHHNPTDKRVYYKEIVAAVHIADYYAWKLLGHKFQKSINDGAFDILNISIKDCDEVLQSLVL